MTWNHRVVRRKRGFDCVYGVHEVYYDDSGKPEMATKEPSAPHGETLDALRIELERFTKALALPVLDYEDFGGESD